MVEACETVLSKQWLQAWPSWLSETVIISAAAWFMLRPPGQVNYLLTEAEASSKGEKCVKWTKSFLVMPPMGVAHFHTFHQGGRREDQSSCCVCWEQHLDPWPALANNWCCQCGTQLWLSTHPASLGVPCLGCGSSAAQLQGSRARAALHLPGTCPHTAFHPWTLLSWDLRCFRLINSGDTTQKGIFRGSEQVSMAAF